MSKNKVITPAYYKLSELPGDVKINLGGMEEYARAELKLNWLQFVVPSNNCSGFLFHFNQLNTVLKIDFFGWELSWRRDCVIVYKNRAIFNDPYIMFTLHISPCSFAFTF